MNKMVTVFLKRTIAYFSSNSLNFYLYDIKDGFYVISNFFIKVTEQLNNFKFCTFPH